MRAIDNGGLRHYRFESWPDLLHGIFTRKGGTSGAPWASLNVGGSVGDSPEAVRQNHELMYSALGVNGARACTVWQVHGIDAVQIDGPVRGRSWVAKADAMVTDRAGVPLVMRYADCTPLFLRDARKGVIGLAHAGWRGTVQGVAANVVRTMAQIFGCRPIDIQAGIGPSIGPERYQVGEEVVNAVQNYFGTTAKLIRRDPVDGSAYFDLWAANVLDLQRAGVEQIEVAAICTAERTDEFFSHRAENGRTGRFGTVMVL